MAVIVTVDPNHPNGNLTSERRIDLAYYKTPPGLIKVAQFVLGVVLLCLHTPIWLSIVVYMGFIITCFWIWIYFFALQSKYQTTTPWNVLEFYYTAGATFAYGITSLLSLITIYYTSAAIFGLLNTAAYGAGTFFLLKDWKEWRAQNAEMQGGPGMNQGMH